MSTEFGWLIENGNQGSMDAAADAYEAEYNAAQESRRAEFDAEMRADAFGEKP